MRLKLFRRAFTIGLLALAVLLTGCTATPYQPLQYGGGFSDRQLGPYLFIISFQGNRFTSDSRAKDFTLLRCAEIALHMGYRYFEIVKAAPNNSAYAEVTIHLVKTPGHTDATDAVEVEKAIRTKYIGTTNSISQLFNSYKPNI